MPRLNYVKKAQKDIYENGKSIEYVSQKGKKKGQTLTKRDRTQPENKKDTILIHKGEPYYWYQFQFRDKVITKTAPPRSALTGSPYLGQIYDLQDSFHQPETLEDMKQLIDDTVSTLEDIKSQCEESLENIPEQLKEANAGSILTERIDALESAISELEGIDCDEETAEEPEEGEEKEENEDNPNQEKLETAYSEASDALGNL